MRQARIEIRASIGECLGHLFEPRYGRIDEVRGWAEAIQEEVEEPPLLLRVAGDRLRLGADPDEDVAAAGGADRPARVLIGGQAPGSPSRFRGKWETVGASGVSSRAPPSRGS